MSKRTIAYCLFAVGFVVVNFFNRFSGAMISNAPIYWAAGIICWITGFILLMISFKKAGNKDQKKFK